MNLLLYKFILYGRLYGRTVFLIVPLAFVKCERAGILRLCFATFNEFPIS